MGMSSFLPIVYITPYRIAIAAINIVNIMNADITSNTKPMYFNVLALPLS